MKLFIINIINFFIIILNFVSISLQNYDTISNIWNSNVVQSNQILKIKEEPVWMHSGKFQGDIDGVDEVLIKQLLDPKVQFNALKNRQLTWHNGIIPYELDEAFSIGEVRLLQRIFRNYRRRTFGCIRFKPRHFESDYLNIVRGNGCYSQVGKTGGKQELSLGQGCLFNETVIHELMHSLGFWHEHSREDRDNHIIIRWENILPGLDSQFDVFTNIIGNTFELSELDVAKIMKLYRCKQKSYLNNRLKKKQKIIETTKIPEEEFIYSENKIKNKLRKKTEEEILIKPELLEEQQTNESYLREQSGEELNNEKELQCKDYFIDCSQFINYCRRISFYFIMRSYCPFTCGRCKKL